MTVGIGEEMIHGGGGGDDGCEPPLCGKMGRVVV